VPANQGYLLQYKDFKITGFDLTDEEVHNLSDAGTEEYRVQIINYHPKEKQLQVILDPGKFTNDVNADIEKKLLEYNIEKISSLNRCTKCVLPSTFPFIQFDENGVCNICNNYVKKNQPKPIEELLTLVDPYRRKDGRPDCLVPFSGGRDSTYTLHIVKNILKMNPIAFTYDWGMVTDLARRNIARVCGKMGVENIIVSADIHWKRANIRKNISAWLEKPHLGMVPLFMAGDKYFYYYATKVKKQNDIILNIYGMNNLENTDFKTGFAGIHPNFNKKRIYSLNQMDQVKLFLFMGSQFLRNVKYINSSILDTLGSFFVRFLNPKEGYYHLFDYLAWNEKDVEETIISKYDWETAIDTKSTWRIGDGTASFYNYVYTTITGFSENDTFRSNQIREGMITREEALNFVLEENTPRYESIKWYLEIIGLDFESVIKKINNIQKLF
jgi:hypothetical protein